MPGCRPGHRSESNCLGFALRWHDTVLRTLEIQPGRTTDDGQHTTRRLTIPAPPRGPVTRTEAEGCRAGTGPHRAGPATRTHRTESRRTRSR
ncbi:hypothetical protein [Saccharothrix violaceirubra]|uniref:hypothetical protein n=1 Tax=Saccharothrix violaceirubra TaxID=413306 RepID=UPI003CD07C0A